MRKAKEELGLVMAVYKLSEGFPETLQADIRRSALTIASKVAAASVWDDPFDRAPAVDAARLAVREVRTFLWFAEDLKHATSEETKPLFKALERICRRLAADEEFTGR